MSVATARVELYSLPTATNGVLPDYPWVKARSVSFLSTMLSTDADYPDFTDYATSTFGAGSGVWDSRMVWNEAHIENDHVTALALQVLPEWERALLAPSGNPVVGVTIVPDRKAQAEAMAAMRRREAQAAATIKALELRLAAMSEDITDGADSRLVAFWAKAHENANEAGFCPEYDRMAEMMDGPRRTIEVEVYLSRTVTYTETARVTVTIDNPSSYLSGDDLLEAACDAEPEWELDSDGGESNDDERVTDYDRA